MRLIDADAIIEVMQKCAENPENAQALLCYRYAQRILEEAPTVEPRPPWHRVEEPPKDACDCLLCWTTIHDEETGEVTGHGFWCEKGWYEDGLLGEAGFYCQSREEINPVRVEPDYWMPLPEPPKEDA